MGMRDFEKEMRKTKEEWAKKKKGMEMVKVEWKRGGDDGKYEGQVKDQQPHGLGKWEKDGGDWVVEGEWQEGELHGRGIESFSNGGQAEYEAKDGKIDGKFLGYFQTGHLYCEYKKGKQHGR